MGYVIWASIFTFIIIIGLAAIGGMLTERSGVVNLSIEGFMTIGAIVYALLMHKNENLRENQASQWFLVPIAGLATSFFSILYALITVKLKANQTIAGVALNTFTIALSLFLIKSENVNFLKISTSLWAAGDKFTFGWMINLAVLLGIPVIALLVIFLNMTKEGKKIKAVGENPHAAASLGINVDSTRIKAIMLSAFIVGMSGAMFAQQLSQAYYGTVQGIGFLAVALVIFGQWKPMIIAGGAVLFGGIYGVINQIELIQKTLNISYLPPKEILNMIPYAVSLVVLIFTSKNSKAPKALGIPYVNAGR